ncbi:phosphatase phospho-type [Mrakia frigida]|uniref:phosphatase phospho-type n=1 Tax=Mrakia frigida TaxID=29902 RepID=UPI003FCBF614
MTTPIPKQLVVYDFDWSFVDQDTDRWILEVLSTPLRRELQTLNEEGKMQYTDIVAHCVAKLQATVGSSRQEIEDALRSLPVHPAMKRAVLALKAASYPQTTLFCLSNSNQVFIDVILKHHNLTDLFTRITTNNSHWNEDGKLIITRRIAPDAPKQHGCKIGCSANMCKGEELEAFLAEKKLAGDDYSRVIYVGDGGNDFCPLLRLRSTDLALVRKGFELEQRIKKEGGLKCQVKYWTMGWEIEEHYAEGGIARQL